LPTKNKEYLEFYNRRRHASIT